MPAYTTNGIDGELRHSEIITGLVQHTFDVNTQSVTETAHGYAIVLTQDCDLLSDHDAAANNRAPVLNGVLLYELQPQDQIQLPGGDIRRRIRDHREERYHLLAHVPPELDLLAVGLPPLVIDFRRYFTMPPSEIYRQCGLVDGAKRRCRLESPYCEHLQNRAAFYLARVALPDPEDARLAAVAPRLEQAAPDEEVAAAVDPATATE